jgi:hypothetical protein
MEAPTDTPTEEELASERQDWAAMDRLHEYDRSPRRETSGHVPRSTL